MENYSSSSAGGRPAYVASAAASEAMLNLRRITNRMWEVLRNAGHRPERIDQMTWQEASDSIETAIRGYKNQRRRKHGTTNWAWGMDHDEGYADFCGMYDDHTWGH